MADPAFRQWCRKQGISTSGIEPAFVAEGWRGVVATQDIAPGTVIMTVPERLLMSTMAARRDPQLSAALAQHQQLSSHQVLAVFLLLEAAKGERSVWCLYIRQLPTSTTACMAWQPAAVQALQLPHAQAVAEAAADKARSDWLAARPLLQQLGLAHKWCSWRAWLWASSAVASRTMYHPGDPGCGCLTPLADLHNHASPAAPYTPSLLEGARAALGQQQGRLPVPQQAVVARPRAETLEEPLQQQQEGSKEGDAAATAAASDAASEQQAVAVVSTAADPAAAAHAAAEEPCSTSSSSSGAVQGDPSSAVDGEAALCGDGEFDEHRKVYKIIARKWYSAGQQVFLTYGRLANLDLLELYGFSLPDNPHETALLPVELLQQHLQQHLQRQRQRQQGERQWRRAAAQQKQAAPEQEPASLDVCAADCCVHASGTPSWQLLSALRLAAASPAEAKALGHLAHSGSPISVPSELVAVAALQSACQQQLESLPSTPADDEQLLQDLRQSAAAAAKLQPDGPQQQQQQQQQQQRQELECLLLAVGWRLCYKRILQRCIAECAACVQLLSGTQVTNMS